MRHYRKMGRFLPSDIVQYGLNVRPTLTTNSVLYHLFYVAEKFRAVSWNSCIADENSVF